MYVLYQLVDYRMTDAGKVSSYPSSSFDVVMENWSTQLILESILCYSFSFVYFAHLPTEKVGSGL